MVPQTGRETQSVNVCVVCVGSHLTSRQALVPQRISFGPLMPGSYRGDYQLADKTAIRKMLIYLAHPADPNGQQAVSQAVKDRGLLFFKAKPCDVRLTVIPGVRQAGYMDYVMNLPAFIHATLTRKRVAIRNQNFPITQVDTVIPARLPPLIYNYPSRPNEATIAKLREHSTVTQGRDKTVSFVMQTPTLSLIQSVAPGANQTTSHVYGAVNLRSMKIVFVLQRLFSAFLLTHHYPAFRHQDDMDPVECPTEVSIKRRKTSNSTYLMCMSKPAEHLEDTKPPAKTGEREKDTDADMTAADTTTVRLTIAKPSSLSEVRWGPIENIPNASGIFIPFVEALAVEDVYTVPTLVSTYFLRSLASTDAGIIRTMDDIRSGWNMVASTRLGHEWSHMAKCIDVALQAQCFIYPIYTNDVYEGTVICGAGYVMGMRDRMYSPSPYAKLQEDVVKNTMHHFSLAKIIKLVGEEHEEDIQGCEDMRTLSKYLLNLPTDEVTKQDIVKQAANLNFTNKYWSTSASNVHKALILLSDPKADIPTDVPMFPKYLYSLDRVEQIMSAFGHDAPTFMIPNGRKCEIKEMEEPPKNLTIRTVSIDVAITDMKHIVENAYVTNNMSNLSARHRDVPIRSEFKVEIWRMLRTMTQRVPNKEASEGKVVTGNDVGESIGDDLW